MARPDWESVKLTGERIIERARTIVHEGNVRQISVKQGKRTVAVFPLAVGVVGALAAPILAAVGALVALLTDCTIEIERRASGEEEVAAPAPKRRPKRPARPGTPKRSRKA
jgi:hypothetical protein